MEEEAFATRYAYRYEDPIQWLTDYKNDLSRDPANKHWEKMMHQHYANEWNNMLVNRRWKKQGIRWEAKARQSYKIRATRCGSLTQAVKDCLKLSQQRSTLITEKCKKRLAERRALKEKLDIKDPEPRLDDTYIRYDPKNNSIHLGKREGTFIPIMVDLTKDSENDSDSDFCPESESGTESDSSEITVTMSELNDMIDPLAELDEPIKV